MMRRFLLLLLCLLLTGCGADMDDGGDTGWEEYQQSQEDTVTEEVQTLPEAFTIAYHKDHTLDPVTCGEGIQQDVADLLYEPLFRLDQQFEPQNVLCESFTISADRCVYTLTIRDGVLFSDGSELTAGDVAATLRRAMESERYAYRFRRVAAIQSSNRSRTVTVTLQSPSSVFVSLLDIPIVKNGTEQQMVPTGTGPYLFVTGSDGPQLIRNSDWWQQKSLPVETIMLVHAKDEETASHLFSSDRVELLTIDPAGGHTPSSGHYREVERPTAQMHYVGFNTTGGVFADSTVRGAFSAGIQRNVLVDAFLSNHATAAWLPISPLSELYSEGYDTPYDHEKTPAEFAAALNALALPEGSTKELMFLVNGDNSFHRNNAEFIAEKLSVGGWTITVRPLPWTEYLLALEQGAFDLYYAEVRLTADWDLSDLIGTDGILNYGRYSSHWMDLMMQDFAQTLDRKTVANRMADYFVKEMPIAPVCFRNFTVLTHTDVVENMSCAPSNTFYMLENWTIQLAQ